MIRQEEFVRDEILPSWFVNRLQDRIAPLVALRLELANPTTVRAVAGANDEASVLNVAGNWRFIEASITRAHPGGAAGTYVIFATAAAQDVRIAPAPGSDFTNYAFALAIVASGGTPAIVPGVVDVYRRIGSLVWDGAAITSLVQEVGMAGAPVGAAGGDLTGSYPNPTIGPLPAGRVLTWGGDTNLYRSAAGVLASDSTLQTVGNAYARTSTAEQVRTGQGGPAGQAGIALGAAADTNLYRESAGVLRTDGTLKGAGISFNASGGTLSSPGYMTLTSGATNDQILFSASAGATERMRLNTAGALVFNPAGAIGWSAAAASGVLDTYFSRSAAGFVRVTSALEAVAQLVSVVGGASQIVLGSGSGQPTIYFGSALDAQLRRDAANSLHSPGAFSTGGLLTAGNGLTVSTGSVNHLGTFFNLTAAGTLTWSAGDTTLTRSGVGILRATNQLEAVNTLRSYAGTAAQIDLANNGGVATIYFGSASDASLARAGANALSTPGSLSVRGRDVPTATEGALRIIRGRVNADGTIAGGTGFTVNKTGTGIYTINFSAAFAGDQATVVTTGFGAGNVPSFAFLNGSGTTGLQSIRTVDAAGALVDSEFRFVTIGTM